VFSGDTGPCGSVLSEFAKGADILVHEVIDLRAVDSAVPARRDGAYSQPGQREALLRHLRTEHTSPEEIGRVAREAR
jgi:ribonuclease BN (tRNA processing enzyme)